MSDAPADAAAISVADPIVGIDLGTTYSLVAWLADDGTARVCADPDTGDRRLPSIVQAHDDGTDVVGWPARRTRLSHRERTVVSVKRFMGRGPDEVRALAPDLPYRCDAAPGGAARFHLGARPLTAPDVSARILRELRRWAQADLGQPVRKAVITVPAYFDDAQRQATRDAGRIAGLEVLRILNEPTAASLAYGLDRLGERTVAVYDLGGGTFDVSILRIRQGVFQVLATAGDTHLGGDDVDAAIAEGLLAAAAPQLPAHAASDPAWRAAAVAAAETAKCALSTATMVAVTIERPDAPERVTLELTRQRCEALAAPVIARTAAACRDALASAQITGADLDAVVLVGGQTRMPLVQARVAAWFGRPGLSDCDPDEVVACGAAVQAAIIAGRRPGVLLLDVIPLTLGLEGLGGTMTKMLERNTPIPASVTQMYTTGVDGQTHVDIHVLQGEREMAVHNRSLARFRLGPLEPLPANVPRIAVTFTVDENGLLRVHAKDVRTLQQQAVAVAPSHGLTAAEIERCVAESYDHAEADVNAAILASARVEGDQLLRRVATACVEPDFSTGDERAAIDGAADRLRAVIGGTDRMAIMGAMHALEEAGREAMQRRADRAIAAALTDRQVSQLLRDQGMLDPPG